LTLIHLLNITVRQPDLIFEESFRLSLGASDGSAKARSEYENDYCKQSVGHWTNSSNRNHFFASINGESQ
jgi:hypothetical protein